MMYKQLQAATVDEMIDFKQDELGQMLNATTKIKSDLSW
jgi:hypothetical protein